MKKVLIALDYGPTAEKVAEAGYSLARAMVAEVVLLHVISDRVYYSSTSYSPVMGFGGYLDIDFMQPDIADVLNKASGEFLESTKKQLADTTIATIIKEGDAAECILAAAKEGKADLIVMGSHSRRWLDAIIMGSVTEKVLHHTSIPLFIIPTKEAV
jgi:nucleotide-binding universal stress UspA family protein